MNDHNIILNCIVVVNCPIETLEDYDNIEVRQSGITLLRGRDYACAGSLRIIHSSEENLGEFQITNLGTDDKKEWPNIRRGFASELKSNTIIRMEGVGDCCWDIYSKKGHSGESKELSSGDPYDVEFQPISIRKKNCPVSYDQDYYEYY